MVQEGLFSEPPIVDRVAEMLPKIVVKRKSRKARCKIIADTLDISLEEAEKAYDKAIERAQAHLSMSIIFATRNGTPGRHA